MDKTLKTHASSGQHLQTTDTIPLVLHRVVKRAPCLFEDIDTLMLDRIIDFIADRWVTFECCPQNHSTNSRQWLLSFDDGNASDFEIVFPALQKAGARAVFFIIVKNVGAAGHLSWEQVREMRRYGMEFGSHGLTHTKLTTLEEKEAWRELFQSRQVIEDQLGEPVHAFSFPYGYYNSRLIQLAQAAGYTACCVSDHGTVKLPARIIPRNSINGAMHWDAIHRTLDPSFPVRVRWTLEDWVKKNAKWALGDVLYRRLRNALAGSGKPT